MFETSSLDVPTSVMLEEWRWLWWWWWWWCLANGAPGTVERKKKTKKKKKKKKNCNTFGKVIASKSSDLHPSVYLAGSRCTYLPTTHTTPMSYPRTHNGSGWMYDGLWRGVVWRGVACTRPRSDGRMRLQ